MDDDDIALADSFINFDVAASSPTSDDPPDPSITGSGSSDPVPPVASSGIEERIESFGLVGSEVNEDESGGVRGEIFANDDDAVGMECEDGEIRGDVIANDDDAVGMESEDGEIRGDVIANDDDAVGMESEDGEIRDDVIANDDEVRDKIVANDYVNSSVSEGTKREKESESSSSVSEIQEEKSELEEGEIVETDIDEDSEDEESQGRSVRLANELENLPRVPPVNVELGPHHILLPAGVVTSIVGDKVIVEGMVEHGPLNEHSVLWITERETPLGFIDETFGPVKSPYYIVRYNSENEIPEGVHEGTLISVVAEFANYVLNCKDLYKKGSDASGMFDEEVSDESEFSDDEEEAEYKRIHRQAKRGQNSQNFDRMKNDRKQVPLKDGSIPTMPVAPTAPVVAHDHGPPILSSGQGFYGVGGGHSSPLPGTGQGFSNVGRGHSSPLLPQQALPQQSAMSPNWPSGFPTNSVAWYQENTQISHQQPMQGIPFQQQFNPSHRFPPPTVYPGGQPNMYAEPMHAQGPMNQNQWLQFPQFQAPTNFQSANILGNLGHPPPQFNPPAYFHSPPISGNLGGPPHQFNPPANFQPLHISGNQGGPLHQFNPSANFRSPQISGNQTGPPPQFNPPANFQSPPTSANQQPSQFHQFNPGAYAGRERTFAGRGRTFAGHGRRPSHRGGKGWQPAR